ncbi:MAG: BrnA antitoxin family protein [Chromatiaceae bacterium]|nr:BrnA antitoxin family protein [Chromatiaceae bacterium]
MPRLKSGTLIPTPQEDVIITAAATSDPDALPLTDDEWEAVMPLARIGRPPSSKPLKVSTTIRFDADVLAALKATGPGWQTRVNGVLREYVAARR